MVLIGQQAGILVTKVEVMKVGLVERFVELVVLMVELDLACLNRTRN